MIIIYGQGMPGDILHEATMVLSQMFEVESSTCGTFFVHTDSPEDQKQAEEICRSFSLPYEKA